LFDLRHGTVFLKRSWLQIFFAVYKGVDWIKL
jgi:hypothetical protein